MLLVASAVSVGLTGIGSATVPPEDRPTITYRLDVPRPPRVCEGRTLKIEVAVVRVVTPPRSAPVPINAGLLSEQDDVPVTAAVADPSILTPPTGLEITGWPTFAGPPSKATFRFKAVKAGETSVKFVANISGMRDFGWPGTLVDQRVERPVRVRQCRFKVSVSSEWAVPGEAELQMAAAIVEADLRADDSGQFSGLARVNWSTSTTSVGDCSGALVISSSTAKLTGTVDEDGILSLTVDYAPASLQLHGNCADFSGTAAPAPLIIGGSVNSVAQGTVPQSISTVGPVPVGEAEFVIRPLDEDGG